MFNNCNSLVSLMPQNSIDDLISKIDAAWIQIKSFPNAARPYTELYHLVVSSLNHLRNRKDVGIVRKTTAGDFGNKYRVEFKRGFLLNDLYIQLIPPSGEVVSEGIFVKSRNIWYKGPLMGAQYNINFKTKVIEYVSEYKWD